MTTWADALTVLLESSADLPLTWMLVGSAATRVQGVAGIEPGDVDIQVHPDGPDGQLWALATRLAPHVSPASPTQELAGFRSTSGAALLTAGDWTFGRWFVDGAKLEVARIRENLDAELVETQGRGVWQHRRIVEWRGHRVPVVPLEVQWATMAVRGQGDRLAAVTAARPASWDDELARRALLARGLEPDAFQRRTTV